MRVVKKPKKPKLHASEQKWSAYLKRLSEWKKYQTKLEKRRNAG